MSEEPENQLRRRKPSGNPSLPLNLDIGYQINEGGPSRGTPSPSCVKFIPNTRDPSSSMAQQEFRKKQQSFEIQVEECEEEELVIDSDEEGGEEDVATNRMRAITPTPIQDFAANVVYTEGPQATDFLKIAAPELECVTDVSDAESEEEN